ncbi:dystroglycan-like [Dorcoceras hygrometricum]|uniref:Dystroglycan-like n=1 Tax=Dorcoceras hygrometricum TaxID=472368 RepID=A0A2Z6ZZQ3_9LAMI|nr:dystroglycan-like [Dorcoceras hygrometricum]
MNFSRDTRPRGRDKRDATMRTLRVQQRAPTRVHRPFMQLPAPIEWQQAACDAAHHRANPRRTAARHNSTTVQTCARGQRPLAGHHARPAHMVPHGCATRQRQTKRQPCTASAHVFYQFFSSTMASTYYSNTVHIDFASVLAMENPGMVSVFNALMASGLEGFLGCPAVIYELDLVDFFKNGSMRDGLVVSIVNGVPVEISEQLFAETFELPVDGLEDLSEMTKDKIFYAKSIVSLSREPVSLSGRKGQMKIEYRLLCDIMAKSISVKAGSFNAITVEKFSLFTAVVCGIRMNWASILFNILKKMVTAGSKQAKGFAIQITLLLENIPNLELGKSSEFPASKILTEKTVHRFVSLNDKVGAEEAVGAPKPKAASKKRPAVDVEAPVAKKKRTMRKKSSSSTDNLEIVAVAQEAVPIQMIEPLTVAPATEDISDQPAGETDGVKAVAADVDATAEKIDEQVAEPSADVETSVGESFEPAVEVPAEETRPSSADDVDFIIQQVIEDTALMGPAEENQEVDAPVDRDQPAATTEERHCDTDEEEATMDVGTAGGDHQVQCSEEEPAVMKTNDDLIDADDQMSLEDILLTISVDFPLPSTGMEITKITLAKTIKIPGVDEKTKYLASLPQIPADDKGKEILVEKNPVKGNPAKEHYFLICADIDLLVHLRAQVIEAVDQFFHSFSFKKLATINIEELSRKEEQVLIWGETEITHVALSRKRYILLKYREVLVRKFLESWKNNFLPGKGSSAVDLKVIDLLSDLHLFVLEELREQALAHGLKWTRTCCSKIVEGSPRDRGAIIARTNTNTPSTCWLRTMIRVDGVWVVEPFCDQWVKIPRPVVCIEVSKQRSFVDFFPTMSEPLRILRKRWADICLEVVGFCASRILLPVGSLHFCSLFSWLPTADITDFLSSIAWERTAFRQVQRSFSSSIAPHVQLLDEQSASSSSSDESMNFDDSTSTPLPAAPIPDITKALNQLRASIEQLRERDEGGAKNKDTLLLHLHNFEKQVIARLDAQDRVLGALRRESHDQRNLLSLELQSSHKQLGTQILTTGLDVVDVRRVVRESHQELNSRINSLDEQVAATRHDLLEFSAQAQQTLTIITSQLSELVAYIHRGGDNKKGESSSSRRPLPTLVHQSEGTGDAVRLTEPTQADIDNANREILERMRNEDSLRAERERDRARRERRLSRSGAYKRRRGY